VLPQSAEAIQGVWNKSCDPRGFIVKTNWFMLPWDQLKDEARVLTSKAAVLRVLADLMSVNAAMILAFMLWQLGLGTIHKSAGPLVPSEGVRHFAVAYAWIWSVLALTVFQLHGFYTRTRGYADPYKAVVIVRAITVFVVAFVIADYFIYSGTVFPRGLAITSWILLLVTIGGSRLVANWLVNVAPNPPGHLGAKREAVLVVGGAGYLGSALVPLLLENGYRVRVLDSLLFGKESLSAAARYPRFELIAGDVRDIRVVVQATKGCQSVIHLAAIVGDPACDENRRLATEVNRAATRMLIDVCRGNGVRRFLFASTCSVYGASDILMDEHAQVAPISLYAQTKVDSEKLLLEALSNSFSPTILRLATLFGISPRPRFDLVVNLLTARAVRTGKITIFNGEQWRPFMHVYDAARSFLTCLEIENDHVLAGEIYNAGSYGLNHRLSDLGELISNVVPTVVVEHIENEDRRNYRVTFDKIHTRLGFVCWRTLEEGVREIASMVAASPVSDFNAEMFNNRAMVRLYAQTVHSTESSIQQLESLSRVPEREVGNVPIVPMVEATPARAIAATGGKN
jgi:nucleoside-diphosphate-sugar epimerase